MYQPTYLTRLSISEILNNKCNTLIITQFVNVRGHLLPIIFIIIIIIIIIITIIIIINNNNNNNNNNIIIIIMIITVTVINL